MKNVLITHSYFLHFDPKQLRLSKPYPPLATLLLASVIRNNGYRLAFYDTQFDTSVEGLKSKLKTEKPDIFIVADDGFNYLTKMCLTNMREAAMEMLREGKNTHHCFCIVSSSDATDHAEKYLAAGADVVIAGEAEETLTELLLCIEKNESWKTLQGIIYNENGAVGKTEKRPVMKNLDNLPLPAWDVLDFSPYKNAWKKHGYFSVNLATTRGCPFKCNWCAKPIYGNRYNVRSAKCVVDEIKYIRQFTRFEHIWFCDDIFGLKPGWMEEFSAEVKKENVKIKYKIQSRADLLQDESTIRSLAESGCDEVWIGAESGSQKILDAMDKGITLAEIERAVKWLKQYHIKPCLFIQFGYLGEEKEDIERTLDMIEKLQPYDIGVSVSYPLPGTLFYEKVKGQLKNKTNWSDSDELAVMYSAEFNPEFYKTLHRFVHKRFRFIQGKQFLKGKKEFKRQGLLLPWFYFSSLAYKNRMKKFRSNRQ